MTILILLVAALVLRWIDPLPAGDPLSGTLLALPLVMAALHGLERAARRRGGRRLRPAVVRAQAGLAAALGLVAAGRSLLPIDLSPEFLAAGLFLLLVHRVAHQVMALRPLLGERLPGSPSWLFFALPLVVYAALIPWSTHHRPPDGDEPFYLLITHSLAHDFDADLTNNYADGDWRYFLDRPLEPQPGDPVGPEGQLFSRHNEALPVALVPAYALYGKLGALLMMAALAAALAWLTLRLARHYTPHRPGGALLAWALFAFAPPLLLYSYQVWVEVPAALLGMIALDLIHGGAPALAGRRPHWSGRRWLALAVPVFLLPLLKIRFMLLAVPLLALAWWYSGRRMRPALALGGALGLLGVGILLYNQALYGNPLKIHSWGELEPSAYGVIEYVKGSLGLFWDSAFGLFACAPLWLLLIPAVMRRWNPPWPGASPALADRTGRILFDLAVFSFPYLFIVVPRSEWYGGWSPPFRYALVALPLLTLLLVPLFDRYRRSHAGAINRHYGGARILLALLGFATLVLSVLWVTVPGWTYSFADGRSYVLDALSARTGLDMARLFPSSIRLRPATWLWPIVGGVVVWLLWNLRAQVRRPASWGAGALLALTAGLFTAASTLPNRVIHFEDPQIAKSGGHVYPERWIIERRRFDGGWTLREGERATAPVVAGGRAATLRLKVLFVRNQRAPLDLEVRAGDVILDTWRARDDREWSWIEVGPVFWPAGEDLVVVARKPNKEGRPNGVILDRVEFTWWP
ncbi:MAG: hypothetical protein AAF481_14160 [Acidobacteriota bacterium]